MNYYEINASTIIVKSYFSTIVADFETLSRNDWLNDLLIDWSID